MANMLTPQNIQLFFWDTLYSVYDGTTNKCGTVDEIKIGKETPTKLLSLPLYKKKYGTDFPEIEPMPPQWETGGKSSDTFVLIHIPEDLI
jgi:hypothetical protein